MRVFVIIVLVSLCATFVNASEWKEGKLIRAVPSQAFLGKTRVTIVIPSIVPLGFWYTCNFFNRDGDIIASARHVLRERVPSTNVVVSDPKDIGFVLCKKG